MTGERKPRVIVFGGDGRPMPVPGLDPGAFRVRYVAGGPRKAHSVAQAIQAGSVSAVYILTRFVSHSDEGVIWAARGDVPVHRVGPARAGSVPASMGTSGPSVAPAAATPAGATKREFPEAGRMTDVAVGALHGVSPRMVRYYRSRRRIPAFALRRDYPEAGMMIDSAVAKIHAVDKSVITEYRRKKGIPAYWYGIRGKRRLVVEWLQDAQACLLSSRALAAYGEVSHEMVSKVRRDFGVVVGEVLTTGRIERFISTRPVITPRRPQRHYDLVGAGTDREVAALYGVSRQQIGEHRRRRQLPPVETKRELTAHYPQAGMMPDAQVAEIHGVSKPTIAMYRKLRGIPSWRSWTRPSYPEAGTMSDSQVAALHGVTTSAIAAYRRLREIPAWVPPQRAGGYWAAGTTTDVEAAALHGVCQETIRRYRRRHGIPRWKRLL